MNANKCIRIFLSFLFLDAFTWGTLIKITGLKCHVDDPLFCSFENCVMKPVRRGVKEVNMVVRVYQKPVTNASVRVEILRRGYTTQSLYQFEIDCCQFWVTKRRNPMAHAVYKFFRLDTYSNLNHSCPYRDDLVFDHLPFDKNLQLPLPIGKGEYVMKMFWKVHSILRCTIDVNIQVTD